MICAAFPPVGGTYRSVKFAKYLPQFGYEPIIVAADSLPHYPQDFSLLAEVGNLRVVRTRWNVLPRFAANGFWGNVRRRVWPDDELALGWLPLARMAVERVLREEKIDLIYTSCSPFWANLEGIRVKMKHQIPWVTDFRDPWTSNPHYHVTSPLRRRLHRWAEGRSVRLCDHYIANTQTNLSVERAKYPMLEGKSTYISNGYDPEDFAGLDRRRRGRTWRVTISGSIYGPYNPSRALEQLGRFCGRHRGVRLDLQYAGESGAAFRHYAESAGIGGAVRLHGYVPHRDSLALMQRSDVLLLSLPDGGKNAGWVPGRLYDYMASTTPIYAVVPHGEACNVLSRSRAGVAWTYSESNQAAEEKLGSIWELWKSGKRWSHHRWDYIRQFDRRLLTGRLAGVFDSLTSS